MRIGILTYHRADNFGAIMQSYALMTYLQGMGLDVEIIDYRCKAIEVHYQIFNPAILFSRKNIFVSLKEYLNRFLHVSDRLMRKRKFESFRSKYLKLSQSLFAIKIPLDYNVIIVGSDQVWNFHLNKGAESIYMLDFPMLNETKRIAYSASSEKNGFANVCDMVLKEKLQRFDEISVRESFLRDKIYSITGIDVPICVDPTFLLSKEHYIKLTTRLQKRKYILVYHMTFVPEVMLLVENIAKEKDLDVIEVFGGFEVKSSSRRKTDWSPIELLSYIAYAEIVFTTSFHGLALSLILEKNVWVMDKGDNLRQKHLLSMVGLSDRLLKTIDMYKENDIDYLVVGKALKPIISRSTNFLRMSIQNEEDSFIS